MDFQRLDLGCSLSQEECQKLTGKQNYCTDMEQKTNLIFYIYRIQRNSLPILGQLNYLMQIILTLLQPPLKETERWDSRGSGSTRVLNISVLLTFKANYCE